MIKRGSGEFPMHPYEDDDVDANDALLRREGKRQRIIEQAIEAADRIICDEFGSDVDVLNWATGQVAYKFAEKAMRPFQRQLIAKDMGLKETK